MAAEQLRVTPYEGALNSGIFSSTGLDKETGKPADGPKSTCCGSLLTLCGSTPDWNAEYEEEDEEEDKPVAEDNGLDLGDDDGNTSKSALKKGD